MSGVAAQKYMEKLREKQSIVMMMADLVIETFAIESGLIRALKIRQLLGAERAKLAEAMVVTYLSEKIPELVAKVRGTLFNVAEGNEPEFNSYQKALQRLVDPKLALTENDKESIAAWVLDKESLIL